MAIGILNFRDFEIFEFRPCFEQLKKLDLERLTGISKSHYLLLAKRLHRASVHAFSFAKLHPAL